jgi:hypothetical protein
MMQFEIVGEISRIETFAVGSGIREIARLRRIYGRGRWRKRKGIARVCLTDGYRTSLGKRKVRIISAREARRRSPKSGDRVR